MKIDNKTIGPWDEASLEILTGWDPEFAAAARAMSVNPWVDGVLSAKFGHLVSLAIAAACTNLQPEATRRHIRAALAEGASRDEALMILKMASVMSIHSCSLGAPILIEEAGRIAIAAAARAAADTPACDAMKAIGQWNAAWDPFYELDPVWTDAFMATGASIYRSKIFSAKEVELLSIAFDASYTHMYAPGTRRHIKGALSAGATPGEIMAVLKLCVAQGVSACNLGVAILEEELARVG